MERPVNKYIDLLCLAIQTNSDGRPCGWGLAAIEADARAEAERRYAAHGEVIGVDPDGRDVRSGCCYDGEQRGPVEIHWVTRGRS